MPKYKFEIKVKETYTAFDYRSETTYTKRLKTVVAKNYSEAREKIQVYLGQFCVSDYTARLIKSSVKEDNLQTWPAFVPINYRT